MFAMLLCCCFTVTIFTLEILFFFLLWFLRISFYLYTIYSIFLCVLCCKIFTTLLAYNSCYLSLQRHFLFCRCSKLMRKENLWLFFEMEMCKWNLLYKNKVISTYFFSHIFPSTDEIYIYLRYNKSILKTS